MRLHVTGAKVELRDGAGAAASGFEFKFPPLDSPPWPALIEHQLDQVVQRRRWRGDRTSEILLQIDDITPFFMAVAGIELSRAPRTLEWLYLVGELAGHVVMQVKHAVNLARPSDLSPKVMPMIEVPGHSAMPSGHATTAYAMAHALVALLPAPEPGTKALLLRLAHRIAVNREVAGVHYPIDSFVGRWLGEWVADAAAGVAKGAAVEALVVDFLHSAFRDPVTWDGLSKREFADQTRTGYPGVVTFTAHSSALTQDPVLEWLQKQAEQELQQLKAVRGS
jgi:membrane-associated phospholipid phosphatase